MGKVTNILWAFLLLSVQTLAQATGPLYPVLVNGMWGYINASGKLIVEPQYEQAAFFQFGKYAIIKKESKYGVLDATGIEVKKCTYDSITFANDSLILVQFNNQWTVEYANGAVLLNNVYDSVYVYATHLKLYDGGKCGLYDLRSHISVSIDYTNLKFYGDKYLLAIQGNRLGVIDENESIIIPFQYSSILPINDSITRVETDGKWGLISTDGKCNIAPKWSRIDFFGRGYIKGLIGDRLELCEYPSGRVITDQYDDYYECSADYIAARRGLKVGIINGAGREEVPPLYDEVKHLTKEYFSVKSMNGYGIIHISGDTILPLAYSKVGVKVYRPETIFSFFKGDKEGVVNSQGEILVPPKFSEINLATGGGFKVVSGRLVGFYSFDGKEIFPARYHVIGRYIGNTIQARYHNCYALANRDTILSGAINDKIVVANNVAKLYRDSVLEVLEINNDGIEMDRYEYLGMDSYSIAATEELPIPRSWPVRSFPPGVKNVWRFSQKFNKWGLVNSETGAYIIEPTYDRIHNTVYTNTYMTEVFIEPTSYKIGGANLTTISLYGVVSTEQGVEMMKPEYVFVQIPIENSRKGHSTTIDFGIHLSGQWEFVSGPEDVAINFIGNRVNNTKRVHHNGQTSFGPYDPQSSTYSMVELVNLITDRGTSWIGDSATLMRYLDEKYYLNCYQGGWGYVQYRPSKKNLMAGKTERRDFYWNSALNSAPMIVASEAYQFGVISKKLDPIIPSDNYSVRRYQVDEEELYLLGRIEPKYGFIDSKGALKIEANYDQLKNFGDGLAPFQQNGEWGYLNRDGTVIIPPTFQRAEPFSANMAVVKKGRYYGTIDRNGREVIPFEYKRIGGFVNGRTIVKSEAGEGLINELGVVLLKPKFSSITAFNDGNFYLVKDKKDYGLFDGEGNKILPTKYAKIGQPGESGVFYVRNDKLYAMFNTSGKRITKFTYRNLREEKEGVMAFKKGRYYGYMDAAENIVIPEQFSNAYNFQDGLAKVKIKKFYGYINKKGVFIIDPIWKRITDFANGYAVAENDSGKHVIKNDGQLMGKLDTLELLTNYESDIALAQGKSGKVFFINPHCDKIIDKGFESALSFTDGLAPVKSDGKWGVINRAGHEIVTPQYHGLSSYQNGFAMIEVSPFYSLTDSSGNMLFESNFETMLPVEREMIYVGKNQKVGYIKSNGSFIWGLHD